MRPSLSGHIEITLDYNCRDASLQLRIPIPHEEWGIKEFHDKEFLTRKTDKENKELTSIKKGFFKAKFELLVENYSKIWYLKNINA